MIPREALARMPKVELHVHLEGAITPEMALHLALVNGLRPPFETPEAGWAAYRRVRDFRGFADLLLQVNRTARRPEDFEYLVLRLGQALAAQRVLYAEVYFTPQLHVTPSAPLAAIFDAMNAARAAVRRSGGPEIRWIPDIVRSYPQPAWQVARWAASDAARAGGVVALGLAGPERGHPAAPLAPVFAWARQHGLPANPHAGEGTSPEAVTEALDVLGARRVGHGTSAAESDEALARVARAGATLEVCPTSNVRLGLFPDHAAHPLPRLIAAGCKVTLATDDPALFETTLTDEYAHAAALGVSLERLEQTVDDAVAASHLPPAEKAALARAIARERAAT